MTGQSNLDRRLEPRISKTTDKERDTRSTATLRKIIARILYATHLKLPVPVAVRFKTYACGRTPPETVGSNSTGAWVFVCCECYVLSGRDLCDELINHPEDSFRLWCVVVCDLETSWMRRTWPPGRWGGAVAPKTNKQTKHLKLRPLYLFWNQTVHSLIFKFADGCAKLQFSCDGFTWMATLNCIKPGKRNVRTHPHTHTHTHTPFWLNWSDWLTEQTDVDPPVNWQIRPYLSMSDIHHRPHNITVKHILRPPTPLRKHTHTHTQRERERTAEHTQNVCSPQCITTHTHTHTHTYPQIMLPSPLLLYTTHLAVIGTLAKISPHFPMQ
jgi:hypothetical protein